MANIDEMDKKVSPHNGRVYMDIASDMIKQKKGLFTFILRINSKRIVDYVRMESIVYGRKDS